MTNQYSNPPAWSTAWIKHHPDRMEHGDCGSEVGNVDADAARPSQKLR